MGGSLREFKGGKNTLGYYITGQRPWERRGHVLIDHISWGWLLYSDSITKLDTNYFIGLSILVPCRGQTPSFIEIKISGG
jgi:hypothetical protein